MARKCTSPGCGFYLPDRYPLAKCPWHMAPGKGPVKIAAALTIAAAGFGGGFAYKRFRRYLDEGSCVRNAKNRGGDKRPRREYNKRPHPLFVKGAPLKSGRARVK